MQREFHTVISSLEVLHWSLGKNYATLIACLLEVWVFFFEHLWVSQSWEIQWSWSWTINSRGMWRFDRSKRTNCTHDNPGFGVKPNRVSSSPNRHMVYMMQWYFDLKTNITTTNFKYNLIVSLFHLVWIACLRWYFCLHKINDFCVKMLIDLSKSSLAVVGNRSSKKRFALIATNICYKHTRFRGSFP